MLYSARASRGILHWITSSPHNGTRIGALKEPRRSFSSPFNISKPLITRLHASNDDRGDLPSFLSPSPELSAAADTPLLRIWLPIGVVLGILMFIDAGYSGDWSRIGALTKETELQLQGLLPVVVLGHGACAAVAGAISAKRGENWVPRAAKTMAGGFVTLVEVILLPDN